MPNGRPNLNQVLEESPSNLFILSLGFEDRCLALPKVLKAIDQTHNRILCIENDDSNVSPLAVLQRKQHRDTIQQLIGSHFCNEHIAEQAVLSALRNGAEGIVIDCSTLPRRMILRLLRAIGELNPTFRKTWLFDCGPADYFSYISGELEITNPVITSVYDTPDLASFDNVSLVMFPGFNCFETAAVLARVINPEHRNQSVTATFVFCHPGAKYEFFERALIEHSAFLRHLAGPGIQVHDELCRMDSAGDVAGHVIEGANRAGKNGVVVVANGGPRVLLGPVFLSVHLLRKHLNANILVTQPLSYRTIRSAGEGELRTWDLSREYGRVAEHVKSSLAAS